MLSKEEIIKSEVVEKFKNEVKDAVHLYRSLFIGEDKKVYTRSDRYRNLVPYLYE